MGVLQWVGGGAAIQVEKAERELAMKKKQIIHIS